MTATETEQPEDQEARPIAGIGRRNHRAYYIGGTMNVSKIARIALATLPLFGVTPVFSEELGIHIFGVKGHQTCADFIADVQNVPIGQCLSWQASKAYSVNCVYLEFVYGYIAKYNFDAYRQGQKQISNVSENEIHLYLRNYCSAHALSSFSFAVDNFISELTTPVDPHVRK